MSGALSPQERDALLDRFERLARDAPFVPLTPRHMDRLTAIDSPDAPVVSLYLDLGPQARQDRQWALQYKNLVREAMPRVRDSRAARGVAEVLSRIEHLLDESVPGLGRGVALFVCDSLGLWQQIALPLPLPNRLYVDRRPYLRPLFRVLDENERFVIALVDNRRARLFVNQQGTIFELADLFEDVPARHDQGGWAQRRIAGHRQAHVQRHAVSVAQATSIALEQLGARWLIAAGTPEAMVAYRRALPAWAAARLAGELNVPSTTSVGELALAAEPLQRAVEVREEDAAVAALLARPAGSGRSIGLAETIRALVERRVTALVVLDRYREAGAMCPRCGLVMAVSGGRCPACDHDLSAVEDVVDLALELAYRQSARIELLRSADARARMVELAPIAALSRY